MQYSISKTDEGVCRYPLHTHPHTEIMYYLRGEGVLRLDGGQIPFSTGTVIIVPPGVLHGSQAPGSFQNISVGGDFSHLFHIASPCALKDNEACEGRMLAEAIFRNRYGSEEYLDALCRAYACLLLQSIRPQDETAQAVQEIIATLSRSFSDAETDVTALLRQSGYAEDYIRARFREITGLTPVSFLTRLRLDHARALLDIYGKELSVAEVSERCGFEDAAYFSRRFKRAFGFSPMQYHKK
ncbi:MAG: helix-turn-helix domain-containing protein [Clostridia bacterium]|nr:helix-turn-helix domain-containing protein [Clostridia bacterium]